MEKKTLLIGRRTAAVFFSSGCEKCPIIYTHFSEDTAGDVASLLSDRKVVIAAIDGVDWDGELSPWPAPRAFRGGNDFAGKAEAYLSELTDRIVPEVEAELGFMPCYRAIAGYSLAGLFSIYALYRTDIFRCAASMSGSLWYDGFLDFMKENRPLRQQERVYFSLGDCEKLVKNERLAKVEACTREAQRLMQDLGAKTVFEINAGNHFKDVPERIAKGIRWICREDDMAQDSIIIKEL